MYTVSKGPSKLVAKTRRGVPQNIEKYELMRDLGRKNGDYDYSSEISVPRPVFQTAKKSAAHFQRTQQQHRNDPEHLSPQHAALIKYINDSWNVVVASNPYDVPGSPDSANSDASLSSSSSTCSTSSSCSTSSTTTLYYNDPPSPVLVDFKPFDLESWWGRRIFNNITKNA